MTAFLDFADVGADPTLRRLRQTSIGLREMQAILGLRVEPASTHAQQIIARVFGELADAWWALSPLRPTRQQFCAVIQKDHADGFLSPDISANDWQYFAEHFAKWAGAS